MNENQVKMDGRTGKVVWGRMDKTGLLEAKISGTNG